MIRTGYLSVDPTTRVLMKILDIADIIMMNGGEPMPDVLIRDLPEHVVAAIDANAQRLGLSRNEYLRRHLAGEVHAPRPKVTVEDLRRSAHVFADLDDPDVMAGAWS